MPLLGAVIAAKGLPIRVVRIGKFSEDELDSSSEIKRYNENEDDL